MDKIRGAVILSLKLLDCALIGVCEVVWSNTDQEKYGKMSEHLGQICIFKSCMGCGTFFLSDEGFFRVLVDSVHISPERHFS